MLFKLVGGVFSILLAGSVSPAYVILPDVFAPVVQTATPEPTESGVPQQPPTDPDVSTGVQSTSDSPFATQIFEIVFSADTLFDAVAAVLEKASSQELDQLSSQTARIAGFFAEILQPPDEGHYASIAATGLRTAAAMGTVLFVVRLALHHWNRLIGEQDTLLNVAGDWVTAGFSAIAAGSLLDLLVRAGWWMAVASLGETADLAQDFLQVVALTDILKTLPEAARHSLFSTVFAVGGGLGGLLGAAGLAFAFAVSQAVLFVLGLTAPVIAVIAVLPQMRWLRALWLKAATVLALLPVTAGGIFKAAILLAVSFSGSGYAGMLIRLFWLWGAVGFMLSIAGILGKFSLTAAVETAGKLTTGMQSVFTTAFAAAGPAGGARTIGSAFASSVEAAFPPAGPRVSWDSSTVSTGLPSQANLSEQGAERALSDLSTHFVSRGLDPKWMHSEYPEDMRRLVEAYQQEPDRIQSASDPLQEAARLSGISWLSGLLSDPGDTE